MGRKLAIQTVNPQVEILSLNISVEVLEYILFRKF